MAGVERPPVLLAAAIGVFLAAYLYLLRDVGLANDEWAWMLYRASSVGSVFDPYNNQPIVGEVLLYRLWGGLVGVGHHWVLQLVLGAVHACVVALVFVLARRRVGAWPAACVAGLVLVLGRAWETLLFPPSLTFVLPTLAAVAVWAVLDGRSSRWVGAGLACLLGLAGVSGGLGIAVLIGLALELAFARRLRDLWIVAAGVLPLVAWYAAEAGKTGIDLATNLPDVPLWTLKYLAASAGAAVGLPPAGGAVVLTGAIALAVRLVVAGPRPRVTPRAVGLAATLGVAVLTTAAGRASNTPATSSRYLYFPAIVMLLLACELTRHLRPSRRVAAPAALAVVVLAAVLGAQQFRYGKTFYLRAADGTAARMGALRLADAPPVLVEPSRLPYGPSVIALFVHRFGASPIDDEGQIRRALPASRIAVDLLLASALIRPATAPPRRCARPPIDGTLPSGPVDLMVAANQPMGITLRRFAEGSDGLTIPVSPPRLSLRILPDRIKTPWRVLSPGATISVCR